MSNFIVALEEDSLAQVAIRIFVQNGEANVVRAAALSLLAAVASRLSPKSDVSAIFFLVIGNFICNKTLLRSFHTFF